MESKPGVLYVVGTPIGNLEDMTFRAIQTLKQVDAIAAEDTRHTGKLLRHFQIDTPQVSYHDHNHQRRIPELLQQLQQGQSIALVTDAGMPGISDPGYELVKACVEAGAPVTPIPGPSAVTTALSASGIAAERFVFEGFLPTKQKERRHRLELLRTESRAIVLYEAPHRLLQTLADLTETLGERRPIALGRELTKLHEEFWRGALEDAIAHYNEYPPRGEFTLVVAGAPQRQLDLSEADVKLELVRLISQGLSRSQASRQLAKQTSLSRQEIYQLSLSIDATSVDAARDQP